MMVQLSDWEYSEVKIGMRVKATLREIGEEGAGGVIHYGDKFVPEWSALWCLPLHLQLRVVELA